MIRILTPAFLFVAGVLFMTPLYGQNTTKSKSGITWGGTDAENVEYVRPKRPSLIKHEISFGYRQHTAGWSAYTDIGKVRSKFGRQSDLFYNIRYFQVELTEKKSPKQEKLTVDGNGSGRSSSYFYGKINNFYALKLGYGFRKMLAGKPDPGSVSIHWAVVAGPALGMVKPYYINVYSDPNAIKYTDATQGHFLDQNLVIGAAGFGMGLSEMQMLAGGHLKSMLHFDFSANRKSVVAIETGFDASYFSAPVKIMALEDGKPWFFDLFISFQFGKRW